MSKYTPSTGTGYTPGSYKSPYGGAGNSPSYNDPFSSQSQNKPTTPLTGGTSYQATATITAKTTTYSDPAPKQSYGQPGGSYTTSGTSYTQSSGGYNPIGGSSNPIGGGYSNPVSNYTPTNVKPGYQPQSGGYTSQSNPYSQPKQNPTPTSFIQPQIKPLSDIKVEMKVEPVGKLPVSVDPESKAKIGKDIFKQTLNKTASVSKYESLMTRLKATGEMFRDTDFSADLKSLSGGISKYASKWSSVVWQTPDEFWGPGYDVFKGKIEPGDIKQGALGDCYFLSTLSALAEVPSRISQLFMSDKANAQGCYAVKICDMGEWTEIVVDNLFPCKNKQSGPIFTKGNDHELWVLILEKAWAKIYGSYAKIEAGLTREVLHDLTGGPTEYFLTQDGDDPEKIWKALEHGEQKNFAMTCGSGDLANGSDLLTSCGLVGSHAYSLLSAITIKTERGPKRLVKLRNPWGEAEWKGDWSDESSLWTPQLKKEVGLEDKNDGIFFMAYEDFCKYFTDIQICRIHDTYEYSSFRFSADPKHANYVRFTVTKEGHHYITINQKSKRHFKEEYEYSDVYLIVGRELPDEEFEYVEGIQKADREVWTEGHLKPGNYIAYVKVPWSDQQPHDVVISTYGFSKPSFELVPKTIVGEFLEKVYSNKAMKSPALKSYQEEGEANAFRCSEVTDDGFGYFFFWNKSESALQTEVFFKIMSGIKLRKPLSGKTFKLIVPPGQKKIVLTKVNPYLEVKQVFSEVAAFQRSPDQLKNLAKEKGQKKQRKHQKTGEMVDIWCYVLQHTDGVFFYYENNTRDLTLDEEVKFKLQGLKIEDDPFGTSAKFVLPPGQKKEIKLKKTLNEFSIGFSTAYLIKN